MQQNIVPNDLYYIRNHWKECPEIDIDTYRLKVDGQVKSELSLSMEDLKKLPQKRFQVTFECCGNSPVPDYYTKALRISSVMEQIKGHGIMGNAEWAGVSLRDVLELAGVRDNAVEVMFEGADHGPDEVVSDPAEVTYERSLPMAKALHPDTLLAYEMNGEPLPLMHGAPLRLLVSGWYGMNSVKWLVGIHVLDHEFEGFLHDRALHDPERAGVADTLHLLQQAEGQVHHHQPGTRRDHPGDRLPAGRGPPGPASRKSPRWSSAKTAGRTGSLSMWSIPAPATPGIAGSITGDRPPKAHTPSCAAPPIIWATPSRWSSPTSGTAAVTAITWYSR